MLSVGTSHSVIMFFAESFAVFAFTTGRISPVISDALPSISFLRLVFLILMLFYSDIHCNHLKKLGERNLGPLCTIFATSHDFVIISK